MPSIRSLTYWKLRVCPPSPKTVNGSWAEHGYAGSSPPLDTSMALLFLSRANINRDLSESLRRYIVVFDPARDKK